jgi:hypothetical protein
MNCKSGRGVSRSGLRMSLAALIGAALSLPGMGLAADMAAVCKGGAGWNQVLQEAKKEGEVLMYSTRADGDNARLLAGFTKSKPTRSDSLAVA